MTQHTPESHLRTLHRFRSFWSSVSKLYIGKQVPADEQEAIKRGVELAYGKEQEETK